MKAPRLLLAIDPGAMFGWALFRDGKLVDSGHCSKKAFYAWKLSPQAIRAGQKLPPEASTMLGGIVVGETPNYRHQGSSKKGQATPNDLITLGILLGELVGLYRRKVDVVEFVTAQEWKGSLGKDICHNRIKRFLEPDETMPDNHNARDAVGIGLFKLGRYRR